MLRINPYLSRSSLLPPDGNLSLIGERLLLGEGDLLPGKPPNPLFLGGDCLSGLRLLFSKPVRGGGDLLGDKRPLGGDLLCGIRSLGGDRLGEDLLA